MTNIKIQLDSTISIAATPQGVVVKTPQGVVVEFTLGPERSYESARQKFNGAPVRVPLVQDAQELAAALRCRQPKRLEYRASKQRERLVAMRKDKKAVRPKAVLEAAMPPEMAAILDAALKK